MAASGGFPRFSKAVQHSLARSALFAALLSPIAATALLVWVHRDQTVAELFRAELPIFLLLWIPAAFLLRYHRRILDDIDRRFFREQYDARRSLLRVASLIQKGSGLEALGRVALHEIEKGLHPRHVSMWCLEDDGREYRREVAVGLSVPAPPLARSNELTRVLAEQHDTLDVNSNLIESRLQSPAARDWIQSTSAALIVPLFVEQEMTGFLVLGERLSEQPYNADARDLITTVAAQLALIQEHARLETIARKDPLTDVLNRHAFYSLLEKKKTTASLITSGSVALVDLNDLKRINDTFGHATGDYALRQVASAIRSLLRPDDLLFRWGGDEFLVIVFGLDEEVVRHRFSMLDRILGETLATPSSEPFPITVAYGVARFGSVASLHSAIDLADKTMYAYKQSRKSGGSWSLLDAQ